MIYLSSSLHGIAHAEVHTDIWVYLLFSFFLIIFFLISRIYRQRANTIIKEDHCIMNVVQ